tara:strand:+ start:4316 stop:6913 length:2598 start_codon:yes stop_codon:yes gene_type:complete
MFSPDKWFTNPSTGFYSHTISQSLRMNKADSPRLIDSSVSSSGNRRKFTFSFWIKFSKASDTYDIVIGAGGSGSYPSAIIGFHNQRLTYKDYRHPSYAGGEINTTAVFRDVSAWYHFVVAVDTTQSTAANRVKMYVNGTQLTDFDTASYPSEDYDTLFQDSTSGNEPLIGFAPGFDYMDGYLADIYNVDNAQLAPSDFGETKDGVWIPKEYSGSFGTTGYHLTFSDSSAIGADTSGNSHSFDTVTNLAATDVVTDSPTNNFATLNPLVVSGGSPTLSEGNLKLVGSGTDYDTSYATIAVTSGKWYAEFLYVSGDNRGMFGVVREDRLYYVNGSAYIGSIDDTYGIDFRARSYTGTSATSSSGSELFNTTDFDTGDIGLLCFDVDNGKLWFGRRDVSGSTTIWYDSSGNNNGDPSAGSNPTWTFTATGSTWFIGCHDYNGTTIIANFGQDGSFANSISSQGASDAGGIGDFNYIEDGFLALCTSNMPDITIGPGQSSQADDHFNTVLWSGNSTNSTSITTGHATDWIWIKKRGTTVQSHVIADTVRGTSNNSGTGNVGILASNLTSAESTNSSDSGIASFDSTGFTIGAGSNTANANAPYQGTNASGHTYVGWSWKAGGTAVSNSDGTNITSNVSANTDAGFSIVSWTGTGVGSDTVGHGLTKKPEVVIVKNRDGDSSPNYWHINHKDLAAADNNIFLNLTSAATDVNTNYSNGGIGLGDANVIDFVAGYSGANYVANANKSGSDYIAYCFHEVQGYSKFGKFSGNGADDGPFIWTGFRPSIVITKRTDAANDWHIMDDQRNPINVMDGLLFANLTTIETSDASYNRDFLSNGFKIRGSEAYVNASGGTFIYLAFAHSPFKFANAF